jgi:uncharacterized membrane protein
MAVVQTAAPRVRVESVDLVRGIIMALMAIDHIRDYFGARVNPTDPATASVALFFTRWVTHFCAPVFFFLIGTGAFLALRRKSQGELSRFLFTRGLWLIFLELTLFRCLGWQWNFDYKILLLIVLWALGWAMIVLAGLVRFPPWVAGCFGVALIAGHNLLDRVDSNNPLWSILHSPNLIYRSPNHTVLVLYTLVPWVGVTAAGFCLGQVYGWDASRRRRFLALLGGGACALFVLLRAINQYGDAGLWHHQATATRTFLSFLNTSKYPPSLLYLLMTLGPALLGLALFDGWTPRVLRPAMVIGKVPMFYYVLHVPLIHLIALVVCAVRYHAVHWMFESPTLNNFPITFPPNWPLALPWIYVIWVGVLLILYPLCAWYARLKQRSRNPLLSYF